MNLDLEVLVLGPIPLVENLLDYVHMTIEPEPYRPLIRLPARIPLHLQRHIPICRAQIAIDQSQVNTAPGCERNARIVNFLRCLPSFQSANFRLNICDRY
jgi:hypothetical protein